MLFYPWLEFYFPLFQPHYHTIQYPKTKAKDTIDRMYENQVPEVQFCASLKVT